MSWLDSFFVGNTGARGAMGPSEYAWSAGAGIATASFSAAPIYELIFANRTGSTVTLTGAYINGGKSGISQSFFSASAYTLVTRPLAGGGDTTLGSYSSDTVAVAAMVDRQITLGGTSVPADHGVFLVLSASAGSGADVGPGVRVYVTT
jgi:hypothetical protein